MALQIFIFGLLIGFSVSFLSILLWEIIKYYKDREEE